VTILAFFTGLVLATVLCADFSDFSFEQEFCSVFVVFLAQA
jgi:hypothetical protein